MHADVLAGNSLDVPERHTDDLTPPACDQGWYIYICMLDYVEKQVVLIDCSISGISEDIQCHEKDKDIYLFLQFSHHLIKHKAGRSAGKFQMAILIFLHLFVWAYTCMAKHALTFKVSKPNFSTFTSDYCFIAIIYSHF